MLNYQRVLFIIIVDDSLIPCYISTSKSLNMFLSQYPNWIDAFKTNASRCPKQVDITETQVIFFTWTQVSWHWLQPELDADPFAAEFAPLDLWSSLGNSGVAPFAAGPAEFDMSLFHLSAADEAAWSVEEPDTWRWIQWRFATTSAPRSGNPHFGQFLPEFNACVVASMTSLTVSLQPSASASVCKLQQLMLASASSTRATRRIFHPAKVDQPVDPWWSAAGQLRSLTKGDSVKNQSHTGRCRRIWTTYRLVEGLQPELFQGVIFPESQRRVWPLATKNQRATGGDPCPKRAVQQLNVWRLDFNQNLERVVRTTLWQAWPWVIHGKIIVCEEQPFQRPCRNFTVKVGRAECEKSGSPRVGSWCLMIKRWRQTI